MLNKIISKMQELKNLHEENKLLKKELLLLKSRQIGCKELVEKILEREVKWIDSDSMPYEARVSWYQEAQSLLKNRVFCSLVGKTEENGVKTNGSIVKEIIENVARFAGSYESVVNARYTIVGIEMIRELVESVRDPKVKQSFKNLHDVI